MILNIGNDNIKNVIQEINKVGDRSPSNEAIFGITRGKMIFNIEQLENAYNNIVKDNYSIEPVTKLKNDLNKLITNYALWDLINWSIPWSGEGRTLDYGLDRNGDYILNGGSEFYIPSHDYLKSKFTPILTQNFTPIKQQDEERDLNELLHEGDEVKLETIKI